MHEWSSSNERLLKVCVPKKKKKKVKKKRKKKKSKKEKKNSNHFKKLVLCFVSQDLTIHRL